MSELKSDNKNCTIFRTGKPVWLVRQFTLLQLAIRRNRWQSTISNYRFGFEAKRCSMKWKFNKQTNVVAMFVDKPNVFEAHLTVQWKPFIPPWMYSEGEKIIIFLSKILFPSIRRKSTILLLVWNVHCVTSYNTFYAE